MRVLLLFFLFVSIDLYGQKLPAAAPNFPSSIPQLVKYSIGEPSQEEQLAMELINRARLNPLGEAKKLASSRDASVLYSVRSYKVNLNMFLSQMATFPASPPLSFNSKLLNAAREHSFDMLQFGYQSHIGKDGSNPGFRMTRNGYVWTTYGENANSFGQSVYHSHAGYEIDWGGNGSPGNGGMQSPAGHRINIHNSNFKEVGIGFVLGTKSPVGPFLSTQDFGRSNDDVSFLTGVIYVDLNNNGEFDIGEGIGGIKCISTSSSFYAVSSSSGGWSIPCPNGETEIYFYDGDSFASLHPLTVSMNGQNKKVDYVFPSAGPSIEGQDSLILGQTNSYKINGLLPIDSQYEIISHEQLDTNYFNGAESGLSDIYSISSTNLSVITNDFKQQGNNSFRMIHSKPEDQFIYFAPIFNVKTNSALSLYSRLSWATSNQVGKVQFSSDDGKNWNSLFETVGTSSSAFGFTLLKKDIGFLAGENIKVRLFFDYGGGEYYYSISSGVGWYIDSLSVSNVSVHVNSVTNLIGHNKNFSLVAEKMPESGYIFAQAKLKSGNNSFPVGKAKKIKISSDYNKINSLNLIGSNVFISFNSDLGIDYDLECSTNYTDWLFVYSFVGVGGEMLLKDAGTFGSKNFKIYRVINK